MRVSLIFNKDDVRSGLSNLRQIGPGSSSSPGTGLSPTTEKRAHLSCNT